MAGNRKRLAVVVTCISVLMLLAIPVASEEPGQPRSLAEEEPVPTEVLAADFGADIELASGMLRRAVAVAQDGRRLNGLGVDGAGGIRVEILHGLDVAGMEQLVASLGGAVDGHIEGLASAELPVDRLEELEATPGVSFLRPPTESYIPDPIAAADPLATGPQVVGEEVAKMAAAAWHAAGFTGQGVKIGIIDLWDRSVYNAAKAAGEVPEPAGTFCRWKGNNCSVWDVNLDWDHGTAVAEIIHELAPDAQLYLVDATEVTDYKAAIDYLANQGADIISHSKGADFDGPGDGTGGRASMVDRAVGKGMAFITAAGNEAGTDPDPGFLRAASDGQYWRYTFRDGDGDGWIVFDDEGHETMPFFCGFTSGLRWSDWGESNPTDYDLYVWDEAGDALDISKAKAVSNDRQGSGAPPLENWGSTLDCNGSGDLDWLGIRVHNRGSGTGGDVLELKLKKSVLAYWSNPYSASGPYCDSANEGSLCVGAIDPPNGTTIAPYSAWGPTNDNRKKPNVAAAAGVRNFTVPGFNGTSAAAPAVAGAAALVLSAGMATNPAALVDYLVDNATVGRGPGGVDNRFGAGELILPPPPPPPSDTPLKCHGKFVTHKGTAGNDVLTGTPGPDVFAGLGGDDILKGKDGDDTFCAGAGNDTIRGGPGDDFIDGQAGTDTASYETAAAAVSVNLGIGRSSGGDGKDVLRGIQNIKGSPHNDTLIGNARDNALSGGRGDDDLHAKSGNDVLDGGPGNDLLRPRNGDDSINGRGGVDTGFFATAISRVIVDLAAGTTRGGDGKDTIKQVENITGSKHNDELLGNAAANLLVGGQGHDVLHGRNGNDELIGGSGKDTANGGSGRDVCKAEKRFRCEAAQPKPKPEPKPEPLGWPACDFDGFTVSGSGDLVKNLRVPGDEPAILDITSEAAGQFVVTTLDANSNEIQTPVEEFSGTYGGVVPINHWYLDDMPVRRVEVKAEGPWTIDVRTFCTARRMSGNSISGAGDEIVIVNQSGPATFTHDGTSNFIVWTHQTYDDFDLEVNEIGSYDGQSVVDNGTVFFWIQADGNWSVSFP